MRTDIADDASISLLVEEPLGPGLRIHSVRTCPQCLHHLADRAFFDQMARLDRRLILHALTVEDRIDPPGLLLDFLPG